MIPAGARTAASAGLRGHHDWTSPEYAREWVAGLEPRAEERRRHFALVGGLLGFSQNAAFRFVDVGCGSGPLAAAILEDYPSCTAVCLDGSAAMLECARENLAGYKGRVRFVEADFSIPGWSSALEGELVDAAVSSIAIHNMFDPRRIQRAYREICQLLKPGGVFVDSDYVGREALLAPHYQSAVEARRRLENGEVREPGRRTGTGGRFQGTVSAHLRWLRNAGFKAADCPWRDLSLTVLLAVK